MLDTVYHGNTLDNWLISFFIILIAIVLTKGIIWLNKGYMQKLIKKSRTNLDDILFSALEKPVLLGVILIAIWLATSRLNLNIKIHEIITNSYQILIILTATWFFARLASTLLDEYATPVKSADKLSKAHFNKRLLPLLKRTILVLIWAIGIVMSLNNIGVKVTTLLGTLGIGGIAFALAAQDTIKNIFGGITLFTDRPFTIGDTVRFDSTEGKVLDIGIRSTRIKTYDNRIVTVANSKIMDALVTNITSEPSRRVVLKIGLTYDTSYEQMQKAIDLLKAIPAKIDDINQEAVKTSFSDFGDSALIITYIYFIKKSADTMQATSKVNFEILRSFNEANLNFAFPSQTIYIEDNKH